MTGASLFWIVVYCCATILFFGVAVVIAVNGARDLKHLLSKSGERR